MAIRCDTYADKPVVAEATIPLSRAVICLDEEHVFDIAYRACPRCGTDRFIPLARWMGTAK